MSEPTTQPSTPTDTHEIATRALESLTDAQTDHSTPTPAAEPSTPAAGGTSAPTNGNGASAEPTAKQVSDAEQLLRDAGYVSEKKPDGRHHWIPRWKVVEMIDSGLKARGTAHEKLKAELETQLTQAQAEAKLAKQWRELMQGEPRAVLERMAQADARYQQYLQAGNAQPASTLPKEEDDPEPAPDIDLGNGRATYSLKGLRERDAWAQRRIERAIEQRLQPINELKKKADEQRIREEQRAMLQESSAKQLTRARSWPKWGEHEQAILKALQDDSAESERTGQPVKLADLHDAYMHVVGQHLSVDEKTMREKIMKELNAAPKSTSLTQTGAEPTKAPSGRSTEEIARRAMAKLEGKA